MKEDLNGLPSGLGFNCFILLISQLSMCGYKCQIGDTAGIKWIKITKRDGFTAYFDSWADVYEFNDSVVSAIAMYEEEEEAEAAGNEQ